MQQLDDIEEKVQEQEQAVASRTLGERIADTIVSFGGSWAFVFLHILWFSAWLVLQLDINLLTLIVSLEAIFLSVFILMSQNRQAKTDTARDTREAVEIDEMFTINKSQLEILRYLEEDREKLKALAEILAILREVQQAGMKPRKA